MLNTLSGKTHSAASLVTFLQDLLSLAVPTGKTDLFLNFIWEDKAGDGIPKGKEN